MYTKNKISIIFGALLSFPLLLQAGQCNVHEQLNAAILKDVTVENLSNHEQTLVNVAKAFCEFGTPLELGSSENLHALQSVDFFSILAKYNHAITACGYRMLQQQCAAHITDEINVLKLRQERIQLLHQHPELVQQLSKILDRTVYAEQKFLKLFQADDQLEDRLYFSYTSLLPLNEHSSAMEASIRIDTTFPAIMIATAFLEFSVLDNYLSDTADVSCISKLGRALYKAARSIPEDQREAIHRLTESVGSYSAAVACVVMVDAIFAVVLGRAIQDTKRLFDIIYEKQQDLILMRNLIKSLQLMQNTLKNNELLANLMPVEFAKLTELFDPKSEHTSPDLKKLIQNLFSSSFSGKGSYLFSSQGKILATHHLLIRIKGELIPYFEAFGQIDAYLATVKLYEQFKDHKNAKFCFPEYINDEMPLLAADNFWHPLLDPDSVVCNDLSMNGQSSHANLIITGPNAGGKTTALMALIINVIFAQSLAIAPSASLSITPFAKIHSSLDITTNLKEGLSLFAAEVDRAKKLKKSIMSCSPGQKTFTIIDELFTGTAEAVAADIGFKFATMMGSMRHSMMIVTTHIKNLTQLEKTTDYFTNYKVDDAHIDLHGRISYPFKLVQGISDQNIAEHMMEQEGVL